MAQAVASEATSLVAMLEKMLPDYSRSRIKKFLQNRCVTLGGNVTSQYDAPIQAGDAVKIYNIGFPEAFSSPFATILWQDDYFIAVEKKAGIATVGNHPGLRETLYRTIAGYVKQLSPSEKIFLLNRLDSETHGIILFARTREVQQQVLATWSKYILSQRFVAVVEGLFEKPEGVLRGRLLSQREHSDSNKPLTRRSRTVYQVLKEGEYSSYIELSLQGRFNGIRSLLREEGMPIIGENLPWSIYQNQKVLRLQQREFTLLHPITNKQHTWRLEVAPDFTHLLRRPLTKSQQALALRQSAPKKRKSTSKGKEPIK